MRRLAVLLAAAMVAAACSGTPEEDTAPSPATTQPQATADPATTEVSETTEAAAPTTAGVETTTKTEPDTTEAEADEPVADTDDETQTDGTEEETTDTVARDADTGDEPETGEAETGEDVDEEAEDGEEIEESSDTEDDTETTEPAEPIYENRSATSVFPLRAYFDHDAIRALFPECPPSPELPDWMVDHFARWDFIYSGWDTEVQELKGTLISSGWWTDEQVETWRPGYGITAASAREHANYRVDLDTVTLRSPNAQSSEPRVRYLYPHRGGDGNVMPTLYDRLVTVGYTSTDDAISAESETLRLIRDTSLAGTNPPGIDMFRLLWNWAQFRTQQPPTTGEPTAYAMRTLLEARDAGCVAEQMAAVCDGSREAESPILGRTHRLGKALRSIVCPG